MKKFFQACSRPAFLCPAAAFLILFILCPFILLPAAHAQNVAELYSAEGQIEGRLGAAAGWSHIEQGQKFDSDDSVRTLAESRAGIRFNSGYLVRMSENTVIKFNQAGNQQQHGKISVVDGIGHFFSRKPKEFPDINTPHVSASVRGTEFVVDVRRDSTLISVLDGAVEAENSFGSVRLGKGEQALTRAGSAPVKQLIVHPNDAVQWALYYPAVFHEEDFADFWSAATAAEREGIAAMNQGLFGQAEKAFSGSSWTAVFAKALLSYRRGRTADAVGTLRSFTGRHPAGMLLLEGSLLLSAGQAAEAEQVFARAEAELSSTPAAAQPRLRSLLEAERSVIRLTAGETSTAESLALAAQSSDADSPAATLALSFVRQAQFRLADAEAAVRRTLDLQPDNVIAKARLAELLLAAGKRNEAVSVAESAQKLDPENAYVLSVLGFAELSRYRSAEAAEYFRRAVKSDSGFALPLLGLGLAEIRQGDLEGGRILLEKAVLLDPTVSLYRSYLGKAYYEEERDGMDEHEFQRAIDLDPLDPTPYLYRAFSRLADHRPVEALEDLQQSADMNDNRGVFRSRLLLDQDQATRSSGLGQIYSRLGFSELARIEATRALNLDYSNYSAHFLLADLYRDTHLNSRAQVTENLLGRLLSPVTFNANDVNLGGEASLNEYTTLFDRPTERARTQGYVRTQTDAFGGQVDYTMNTETLGLNLGYAGSYRGGFRDNDWLRTHQLFNLGQYALSPDDTLVWDAALTAQDQGDIVVNFDPHDEDADYESKFDGALIRTGYHRRIGPGLNFLSQIFYNYGDYDGRDGDNDQRLSFLQVRDGAAVLTPDPFSFDGRTDEITGIKQHLSRADAEMIWDTEAASLVVGSSVSVENLKSEENGSISNTGSEPVLAFLQGLPLSSNSEVDEYSNQDYAYLTFHLTPWLDLNSGLTYSWLKYGDNSFALPYSDETFTRDQWGPKAGLVAQLGKNATARLAYSRSLDRTGRGGLGPLEPTFVGGFNQVYDGVRGSSQDLYAAGLDFKLGRRSFTGVSYQRRNLDAALPIVSGGLDYDRANGTTDVIDMLERINGGADIDRVNVYLYQIFNSQFAGTLDYNFERFDENDPFPETQTNTAAARLNYFHESGLFAFSRGTFRYQERAGVQDEKSTGDFWIFDAGIGYEFNHRHGAVALQLNNIFDRDFRYSAIADEDPLIPRFGAELNVNLNF
jgi:tetratricopeptide (TPR) repeat protein